jgi:hypothetical protein
VERERVENLKSRKKKKKKQTEKLRRRPPTPINNFI